MILMYGVESVALDFGKRRKRLLSFEQLIAWLMALVWMLSRSVSQSESDKKGAHCFSSPPNEI